MRHTLASVALLVLLGCGDRPPSAELDTPLRLEEVARFGSRGGGGSALTAVAGVVASSAEVFVLESSPPRIAVFARDAAWRRDIGRGGDGPGELRGPSALGLSDGLVWVADRRGGRLELFGLDGRAERSVRWSVPADPRGTVAVPYAPLVGGYYLGGPAALPVGAVFTGAVDHRTYFRVSPDGVDSRPIYTEEIVTTDFASADVSGRPAVVLHPHPQSPLVRVLPDGSGILAVERRVPSGGDEPAFRVLKVDPDGEVLSDWTVKYAPVEAVGWRERFGEEMSGQMQEQSGAVDQALLSALEGAPVDIAFLPPVTEAVAGADGSVWLRREDTGASEVRWDVHAPSGSVIGRTWLPRSSRVLRASREDLWVVELDELDVPFVVHYRVVR